MTPDQLKRRILKDIEVELADEFDKNFERKGFFADRWEPRHYQNPKGSLLMVTGRLRRSIKSHIEQDGVRFTSDTPYAGVHNEGGTVNQNVRAHNRRNKKTGKTHQVRAHQRRLTMPKRQFVGDGPDTQRIIKECIDRNLEQFAKDLSNRLNP